jgi:hypothetical protein
MIGRIACAVLLAVGLTATAASAKPPQKAGTEVGPPHTVTAYDPSRGCTGDGPVAAQGWCDYYDGPTSGQSGHPVELAATVCRLPGQDAHTLQVETGEQAQFSAATQESPQWTWSKGHHFSTYGTTFNVAAGSCLRWHVSWNVVDDAGRPLAPGVYSLVARPLAHQAGSIQAQAYLNAVYFTVT